MPPEKKELTAQEVDQQTDDLVAEMNEEDEDDTEEESTEDAEESESEEEDKEESDPQPKDKTQKRIDQLTAAKKTLEEQLTESKEALEEAREKTKFLEDELLKTKQAYGQGVSNLWTKNGKHMYELTVTEFSEVVDMLLSNAEASQTEDERRQWMKQLKECNLLRNTGQDIAAQEASIANNEQSLWEYEWGLVSKALLEEAPQLSAHAEKLNKLIVPVFLNRKKDNDAKFLYRKLAEGGVEAKFKHVVALMKKEGIYDAIEKEDYKASPNPGKTVGKGAKSPTQGETRTFTRAQIKKMSVAEFERNEAAINKALSKGLIR